MAKQLIIDLYHCDKNILNDERKIKSIAQKAIESIGASIVKEHIVQFQPIGISYFAVISSSHFSIHTWPEHGYVAIDLFSCNDFDSEKLMERLKKWFSTEIAKSELIERKLVIDQ